MISLSLQKILKKKEVGGGGGKRMMWVVREFGCLGVGAGGKNGERDTYDFPTQNASLQNTACTACDPSME